MILPGIGAFINHRHPCVVNRAEGIIIPASREICFNASICTNDGLLAHSIARREKVSFEEALLKVDTVVAEISEALALEGEISIGNVGTLYQSDDGRISFRQRHNATAYSNMLGYYPINLPSPQSDTKRTEEKSSKSISGFRPDKYYYIPINKTLAKTAAIFICVLAVCMGIFLPFHGDERNRELASVVPIEKVSAVISKKCSKPTLNTTSAPQQPQLHIITEEECVGKHFLIVGTFRTLDEVNKYINQIGITRKDVEIIESRNYMISAFSSTDRAEVAQAMTKEEIKTRFGQFWIYSK
ncbi:MAG: hypothetical protein NC201_07875 [Prevotella sp.]|nr:hypothetical protein [Prevotella sp.]